jgi:hypothetical protein
LEVNVVSSRWICRLRGEAADEVCRLRTPLKGSQFFSVARDGERPGEDATPDRVML